MIYVNLGPQSKALQVQQLLRSAGVPAGVVNTPEALKSGKMGCGYSVQVPEHFRETAEKILRRKGIYVELKSYFE